MGTLKLTAEGDLVIVGARWFAGPPEAVYRAHLDPEIVPRWMLGPPGWTMPTCLLEPWPGGRIRYAWSNGAGGDFHLTGEFLDLRPFSRIVHVERMHLPDPTPDNRVESGFAADGVGTLMSIRMTLPDAATCSAMLDSDMEDGMEQSYARLDALI
jgi:uncharacterized protein YndB with AHSA1/START domain